MMEQYVHKDTSTQPDTSSMIQGNLPYNNLLIIRILKANAKLSSLWESFDTLIRFEHHGAMADDPDDVEAMIMIQDQ